MPTTFFSSLASFDPVALMQAAVMIGAAVLLFLLLYTLRDIILRTHSFMLQALCVLLVGALPVIGFLIYLLIRPPRTIKEREMYAMFEALTGSSEEEVEMVLADMNDHDTLEQEPSLESKDSSESKEISPEPNPTLSL